MLSIYYQIRSIIKAVYVTIVVGKVISIPW